MYDTYFELNEISKNKTNKKKMKSANDLFIQNKNLNAKFPFVNWMRIWFPALCTFDQLSLYSKRRSECVSFS